MHKFKFGIEHEVAFIKDGKFIDFSNVSYEQLDEIIKALPIYPDDHNTLRTDEAKIVVGRWYIEGLDRFKENGEHNYLTPKGIEIRTVFKPSIDESIKELQESFRLLKEEAEKRGYKPVGISFNPFLTECPIDPPYNKYERIYRTSSPEKATAHLAMVTYGPDLSISLEGLTDDQIIEIGQKLTYYSPFIVPFSFSSPFYEGKLWGGLSVRTFRRSGQRPTVLVYLNDKSKLIKSTPSMTKLSRLPAENGRIEFKAFDTCFNFEIYAALMTLLKGLLLDNTLPGRALVPDTNMHQLAAKEGFNSPKIAAETEKVLKAVKTALVNDPDQQKLSILEKMLETKRTPSDDLIEAYNQGKNILDILERTYS